MIVEVCGHSIHRVSCFYGADNLTLDNIYLSEVDISSRGEDISGLGFESENGDSLKVSLASCGLSCRTDRQQTSRENSLEHG